MSKSTGSGASTPKPPQYPLLFFAAPVVAGLVIHFVWDVRFLPAEVALISGIVVLIAGAAFGMWAVWTMFREGERPEPSHPTNKIVTTGPFRFSRNPIYVSFVVVATGLGLGLSSIPVLAGVATGFAALALWVVPAEERYLSARFGDEYQEYCKRVRRWV